MNERDRRILLDAKFAWIRRLAAAGHTPLTQGESFECAKCGLSGTLYITAGMVEMVGGLSAEPKRCARD